MQRMLLFAELSRLYEVGRGSASKDQPRSKGKFEPKDVKSTSIGKESVLEKCLANTDPSNLSAKGTA